MRRRKRAHNSQFEFEGQSMVVGSRLDYFPSSAWYILYDTSSHTKFYGTSTGRPELIQPNVVRTSARDTTCNATHVRLV